MTSSAHGRPGALEDRVALVVGGASGIGRAVVEAYTAEGAVVVVADRDGDRAAEAALACGAAAGLCVDVADEASVEAATREVLRRHGRVDVLVNSAGVLDESPVAQMSLAQWQRTVDVDLTGVFLACRAVLPSMLAAGSGRIISVASQLGLKGGVGLAHYSAAKAGVIGLTKALAREVAPSGVLVNAIAPGPVETPMVAGISEQWKVAKRAELPLGRFGVPAEVAPTAVLLASDPGGNLYVGQVLGPNSGDVMP